jgi:coenzyme F420-0:L-glutamate ligase / coenzyme F420-1:gamma-L-glutamate ligase
MVMPSRRMSSGISITALPGIGDIASGDDLVGIIADALDRAAIALQDADIIVVAQKIVSKAEGRLVDLATVAPSARALELAGATGKDPRLIELILGESTEVMRAVPNVLVVRHRLGLVMANAGIDRSNLAAAEGREQALLLPVDPDASAAALRSGFAKRLGAAPAVLISDSFGRAWRIGTVNIAIGAAGFPSIVDRRGEADRYGRTLESTELGLADAVAAAAGLAMGEAAEGTPVVHLRGLAWDAPERQASALVRPLGQDLFR